MLKDIYFLRIWFCNIFCVFCRLILWKDGVNKQYWKLIDHLQENKHLGLKWIFRRKITVDGTVEKYKARLCVKGFRQKEKKGFDLVNINIYSLVIRITSIRMQKNYYCGIWPPNQSNECEKNFLKCRIGGRNLHGTTRGFWGS